MKRMLLLLFISLLSIILAGCSAGPSQESLDRAMKELSYQQTFDGIFEISNMRKTNSWKRGDDTIVEFSYDRKALYGINEATRYVIEQSQVQDATTLEEKVAVGMIKGSGKFGAGLIRMALEQQHGYFEKGQAGSYIYKVGFYETEEGWRYYF